MTNTTPISIPEQIPTPISCGPSEAKSGPTVITVPEMGLPPMVAESDYRALEAKFKALAAVREARDPKAPGSARWLVNGEPDPHDGVYKCERSKLSLSHLTDDELANGAFLNYDKAFDPEALLKGKVGYYPPILWMTAVKDRIRWLSRQLEHSKASLDAIEDALIDSLTSSLNRLSQEDFCYCCNDISLQIVAGGGSKGGLYSTVTLKVGDKYVVYERQKSEDDQQPAAVLTGSEAESKSSGSGEDGDEDPSASPVMHIPV